MNEAVTLFVILIAALPLAAVFLGKRFSRGETDEEIALIREDARTLENKIIETLAGEGTMVSKGHLTSLKKKAVEYSAALDSQKAVREELETKLSTAHEDVLARESAHRDMKAEKQDNEVSLQSLLSSYNDISSESVSLEQRLAESLKTIDKMTAEVAMSEDQRAVFESLSSALTNASAQLRDVIVAHQNVYERLEALRSQYADLEGEYIKLVELQLEA
jgi:chromosome segregation ATPase